MIRFEFARKVSQVLKKYWGKIVFVHSTFGVWASVLCVNNTQINQSNLIGRKEVNANTCIMWCCKLPVMWKTDLNPRPNLPTLVLSNSLMLLYNIFIPFQSSSENSALLCTNSAGPFRENKPLLVNCNW